MLQRCEIARKGSYGLTSKGFFLVGDVRIMYAFLTVTACRKEGLGVTGLGQRPTGNEVFGREGRGYCFGGIEGRFINGGNAISRKAYVALGVGFPTVRIALTSPAPEVAC